MRIISHNAAFRSAVADAWQKLPYGAQIELDSVRVLEDVALDCWGLAIGQDIRLLPVARYRDSLHLFGVLAHEACHVWLNHSAKSVAAFNAGHDLRKVNAAHEREVDDLMRRWHLYDALAAIGRRGY